MSCATPSRLHICTHRYTYSVRRRCQPALDRPGGPSRSERTLGLAAGGREAREAVERGRLTELVPEGAEDPKALAQARACRDAVTALDCHIPQGHERLSGAMPIPDRLPQRQA